MCGVDLAIFLMLAFQAVLISLLPPGGCPGDWRQGSDVSRADAWVGLSHFLQTALDFFSPLRLCWWNIKKQRPEVRQGCGPGPGLHSLCCIDFRGVSKLRETLLLHLISGGCRPGVAGACLLGALHPSPLMQLSKGAGCNTLFLWSCCCHGWLSGSRRGASIVIAYAQRQITGRQFLLFPQLRLC